MALEAGNELQSITADMPIYINLKQSHIDNKDDDDDDDDEIIDDNVVPLANWKESTTLHIFLVILKEI